MGALFMMENFVTVQKSRAAAEEAGAASVLRSISHCASQYESKHHSHASTLAEMATEGCLDAATVSGKKGEYRISYSAAPSDAIQQITTWHAHAQPIAYRWLTRSFFIDNSGVMRATDEHRPATPKDPAFESITWSFTEEQQKIPRANEQKVGAPAR